MDIDVFVNANDEHFSYDSEAHILSIYSDETDHHGDVYELQIRALLDSNNAKYDTIDVNIEYSICKTTIDGDIDMPDPF